jgi:hypothetical protein
MYCFHPIKFPALNSIIIDKFLELAFNTFTQFPLAYLGQPISLGVSRPMQYQPLTNFHRFVDTTIELRASFPHFIASDRRFIASDRRFNTPECWIDASDRPADALKPRFDHSDRLADTPNRQLNGSDRRFIATERQIEASFRHSVEPLRHFIALDGLHL